MAGSDASHLRPLAAKSAAAGVPTAAPTYSTRTNPKTTQEVATNLEDLIRSQIAAINGQQMDINDPIWSPHFTQDFKCHVIPVWSNEDLDLQGYLNRLKRTFVETPEYQVVITDISTEVFGNHWAQLYVSSDAYGVPPGVVRPIMAVYRFRKDDEVWKCFAIETIPNAPLGGERYAEA